MLLETLDGACRCRLQHLWYLYMDVLDFSCSGASVNVQSESPDAAMAVDSAESDAVAGPFLNMCVPFIQCCCACTVASLQHLPSCVQGHHQSAALNSPNLHPGIRGLQLAA